MSKATNIFMDSSNLCRQNKLTAYKVLMWFILLDLSFSGSDVIFCGIEQNNEIWFDSLHPSKQFFSHVGAGLPVLKRY